MDPQCESIPAHGLLINADLNYFIAISIFLFSIFNREVLLPFRF